MMFKDKKMMSDNEKKAKLAALKGAHSMASDAMKEGLNGAKKVSVMADSPEGLKKGLDLAEKVVGEVEDEDSELGEKMEDAQEGYEDQQEESMPMDEDEIEAEIQRLMELKAKLSQE